MDEQRLLKRSHVIAHQIALLNAEMEHVLEPITKEISDDIEQSSTPMGEDFIRLHARIHQFPLGRNRSDLMSKLFSKR